LTFKEPYSVISQKIEIFITTAMAISNPKLVPSSSGYGTNYGKRVYPVFMIPGKNIPGSYLKISHE
jgi:hypothetical protein